MHINMNHILVPTFVQAYAFVWNHILITEDSDENFTLLCMYICIQSENKLLSIYISDIADFASHVKYH